MGIIDRREVLYRTSLLFRTVIDMDLSGSCFCCFLIFAIFDIGARGSVFTSRIRGGENAMIAEYPYQISLEYFGHYICGGAIVNNRYVLTTASCAQSSASDLSIRAGTSLQGQSGMVYHVDKVVPHEKYTNLSKIPDYDVAVLRIREEFQFNDECQPALLSNQSEIVVPGSKASLTGWGDLGNGELSIQMQVIKLEVIEKSKCREILKDGQMCAKADEGKDVCPGDMGSPLSVKGRLVGLAAWGFDCGRSSEQAVFTEIGHFRDWIDEHAAY